MRTKTLTIALVSALLVVSAGAGGVLAATSSLQAQQSPTGTTDTGTGTGTTGGSGAGTTTTAAGAGTTTGTSGPSVTFNDQNSSGETVLVQSATVPENGFVAIYDSSRSGNETNQVIGASYLLNAGTSDNIRIQLDQPLNQTKSLTAVVHTDSNGNGNFDYVSSNGQQDPPLTQGDRRIVDIAQVSTQGGDAGSAEQTESGGASGTGGATEASGETQTAASGAGDGGTAAGGNASGNGGGGGESGSSGPGFGLAVAVVALLAVALLAVRRN